VSEGEAIRIIKLMMLYMRFFLSTLVTI